MTPTNTLDYTQYLRIHTILKTRPDNEVNQCIKQGWEILAISSGKDESGYPITSVILGSKYASDC